MESLSGVLEAQPSVVRRHLGFWVGQGVLKENPTDTFTVIEEQQEGATVRGGEEGLCVVVGVTVRGGEEGLCVVVGVTVREGEEGLCVFVGGNS